MTNVSIKKVSKELCCLADQNRIEIITLLQNKERCVCEIWQELDIPQNLASHHLKVLKDHKIIKSRKDGLKVFYSLDRENLEKIINSINSLFITKNK